MNNPNNPNIYKSQTSNKKIVNIFDYNNLKKDDYQKIVSNFYQNKLNIIDNFISSENIEFLNKHINLIFDSDKLEIMKKNNFKQYKKIKKQRNINKLLNEINIDNNLKNNLIDKFNNIDDSLSNLIKNIFNCNINKIEKTFRFTLTKNENLHYDIFEPPLQDENIIRVFINIDNDFRVWNNSYNIYEFIDLFENDIIDKMIEKNIDLTYDGPNKINKFIVDEVMESNKHENINYFFNNGYPKITNKFGSGSLWICDSIVNSHQIIYGQKCISYKFYISNINNGINELSNNGINELSNNGINELSNNGINELSNNGINELSNNGINELSNNGINELSNNGINELSNNFYYNKIILYINKLNMIKNYNSIIPKNSIIKNNLYLNIENYWNIDKINDIIKNYPTKKDFELLDNEKNNENRKNIRIKEILNNKNNFNQAIIDVIKFHSEKSFFHYLIDVFKLDKDLKNKSFGIHEIDKNAEIVVKINLCVNYPNFESVRGIHLDKQNSILFGLLYLRKDNDKSTGSNLNLFKFKNNEIRNDYIKKCDNNIKKFNKIMEKKLNHDDLIKIDKIKYNKNNIIWLKNSWDTIHSVTQRINAIEDRIFINFVYMYNK